MHTKRKGQAMNMQLSESPQHVAFIMDGNGRWATRQGKPRPVGHRDGADTLEAIIEGCIERNIAYVTAYTFSTYNWKRDALEVKGLMRLFGERLQALRQTLLDNSIKVVFIGNREDGKLSAELLATMSALEHATGGGERLTLILALNYSSTDELERATRKAFANQSIDVRKYLDSAQFPDPDLVVRTGCQAGCWYDSDFLVQQSRNALKWPCEKLWPDFTLTDLDAGIALWRDADRLQGAQRKHTA